MQLSDLTAYAENKYHIKEEHKWEDSPAFSILADTETGKWVAFLIRHWNEENGSEQEICDIKCGYRCRLEFQAPYLSSPHLMNGKAWLGIRFDDSTDPDVVYQLFDRAVNECRPKSATFVLDNTIQDQTKDSSKYHETPLPKFYSHQTKFQSSIDDDPSVPQKIIKMKELYKYGDGSFEQKCRNFYVQGKFMEDYEDNAPWQGSFHRYFPTYFDLNTMQLRGYFTWRTDVRNNIFKPICISLAYLYVYELLNEIGCSSPSDALEKINSFKIGFIESGIGDVNMLSNIHLWMLDFCILNDIPPEIACKYIDAYLLRSDDALTVLRHPQNYEEERIFDSLYFFAGNKLNSALFSGKTGKNAKHLIVEVWKHTLSNFSEDGKSLFSSCFGYKKSSYYHPLGNAIYFKRKPQSERTYELNGSRKYSFKNDKWVEQCYQSISFDKEVLSGLIHEAERLLRIYLDFGHPLKRKEEEAWATPFVQEVIEADRKAKIEAARPKVVIRFSDLDQIRQDAVTTRDSLLTDDDLDQTEDPLPDSSDVPHPKNTEQMLSSPSCIVPSSDSVSEDNTIEKVNHVPHVSNEINSELPLNHEQIEIMSVLLHNESVKSMIASRHGMVTVIADAINEVMFDLFGDNVVECDGDDIYLVDDYREDILRLLNGR